MMSNAGTSPPPFSIDPTYGAVGFTPEEREESLVHKHRVLAHEALMRIDAAGKMGAWRAARAYGRVLLTRSGAQFESRYHGAAQAFAESLRSGADPSEVIGSLLIYCDEEGQRQGRHGREESSVSREDFGTGLVVGPGRLAREDPKTPRGTLRIDETISYDTIKKRVVVSDEIDWDGLENPKEAFDAEAWLPTVEEESSPP